MKKIFIILISSLLMFGCTTNEPIYKLNKNLNEPVLLNKWRVVGPFIHKPKADLLDNELKKYELSEEAISYDEFQDILTDTTNGIFNKLIHTDDYLLDFINIYGYDNEKSVSGNIYCGCTIKSERARKVMLNFSVNDACICWLNNQEIFKDNGHKRIKYYDNYIELDLKKGNNFLLVKIRNYTDNEWEFFAFLEKWSEEGERRHNVNFMLEYGSRFLDRPQIVNGKVNLCWAFPKDKEGRITIEGNGIKKRFEVQKGKQYIGNISDFPDGLYKVYFYMENDTCIQNLYKGDIHKAIGDILNNLKKKHCNIKLRNDINAYAYRYHHLMKPENMPQKNYLIASWQYKILFLYKGLCDIDDYLNGNKPVLLSNIHTYVSKIDNGVQYYKLFVPEKYDGKEPLPLMIEMPTSIKRFPHPLESFRFADMGLIELFTRMSNKYNMLILCFDGRTIDRMNVNNIDEIDMVENIKAIKKMYHIDSTRMYLRGACRSAYHTLKFGVKNPDIWAGISITAPAIFSQNESSLWKEKNNVLEMINNLRYIPILDIHSAIDKHMPIESSEYISHLAKKGNFVDYNFVRLPFELEKYYSSEYMENTIEFFLNHSTKDKPQDKMYFSTYQLKNNKSGWLTIQSMQEYGKKTTVNASIKHNKIGIETINVESFTIDLTKLPYNSNEELIIKNNGKLVYNGYPSTLELTINSNKTNNFHKNSIIEGPFCHLFLNPFIIVKGTIGTRKESALIDSIAITLNNKWKEEYYSSCRIKADTAISQDEIMSFNLLLLGNEHSNSIIKKHKEVLPLEVSNSYITISDHRFEGKYLNYYLIYPNPENKGGYIGILGSNNTESFRLASEESSYSECKAISNFGWYDYRIWDNRKMTEKKGYFDNNWAISKILND